MNKVWTTKDFKERRLGIVYGGDRERVTSILKEVGLEPQFLGKKGNYMYINHLRTFSERGSMPFNMKIDYVDESKINLTSPFKNLIEKPISPHYDNSNGSLYLFAQQHNLNAWEFDIIKRIVRCRKKGDFEKDLQKTKVVIDLYLKEFKQ